MRRWILSAVALLIVALLGFYVAWPAWSGYRIKTALDARDAGALSQKIDFDGVRDSLTPVITQKVEEEVARRVAEMGPLAQVLAPKIKKEITPRIVEIALTNLVTPEAMIRIVHDGGSMKERIERIMREQMGKLAGNPAPVSSGDTPPGTMPLPSTLGGIVNQALKGGQAPPQQQQQPANTPAPSSTAGEKPKFSLANVKSFRMTGLASFAVGVARDAKATAPELIAEMAFRGGDWRLVGVTPLL